jgi:CHAT domain-containing protein/tetratricopeptide (TPR) repeat protein
MAAQAARTLNDAAPATCGGVLRQGSPLSFSLHLRMFCPTLTLALGVVLAASGCWRAASPEATFLQIREQMGRGQLDAAVRDVDAALAKYQGKSPEWAARFRVQKAHILMQRGSYSESLQISNEPLPPSLAQSDTEVEREMLQGLAHSYLQQFELADIALSGAESIATTIQSSFLGDVAQARGILEMERKNYAKAAVAYRTAAAFAKERNLPRSELIAMASLGNIAIWQDHYDEAADRFRAALEKSRFLGAAIYEAKALGNLGWAHSVVGDYENAEVYLTEAESKSAQTGLVDDRARWVSALAEAYFRQRRYSESRSAEEKALAQARKQDEKGTLTGSLNTMSEIALATGRLNEAEKYNREAQGIEQAGLDQFGTASSTIIAGRIAAGKKEFARAEAIFQRILADSSVETPLKWQAHARLADVYAAERQPAKAEHEFNVAIGTFQSASDYVRRDEFRLSFLSTAIEFYDSYVNFLIDQKRPIDALKIADKSRAQTLERGLALSANGVTNRATGLVKDWKAHGPAQTAALRPQEVARRWNATLLFYWLGEERSHLWVITPAKVFLLPLPRRAEIDSGVKSYLGAFPDPRDPLETSNVDGKKLYETLIEPAEKLIPRNSRVIILPDGELNSLNFETLIVPGEKPHYWIEDVTLFTGNSLALLAKASPSPPPKDANLFLMGDALQASPDFPALPQASKEVGLVQNYFSAARRTVLTGAQAVPSRFLSGKPEEFSYLHFATHGTASTTRPLESAVILSPEVDGYKLYARDIVQHPVDAYLVTISACNGAGMKTYAGEGLVGLAWAFLRDGAHSVIAGLWEVSNASTPQLMDELYKGLRAGKDPATALRNAKLTLVRSGGNYRKPFYWAPFQLYAGS